MSRHTHPLAFCVITPFPWQPLNFGGSQGNHTFFHNFNNFYHREMIYTSFERSSQVLSIFQIKICKLANLHIPNLHKFVNFVLFCHTHYQMFSSTFYKLSRHKMNYILKHNLVLGLSENMSWHTHPLAFVLPLSFHSNHSILGVSKEIILSFITLTIFITEK